MKKNSTRDIFFVVEKILSFVLLLLFFLGEKIITF